MLDFNKEELCVGCTNCYSVCPTGAVEMSESERGFYIPRIFQDKCISCGHCDRTCPVLIQKQECNTKDMKCSYVYAQDLDSRLESTSGGLFYELARYTVSHNGTVCGCVWDDDFTAKHICTQNLDDVKRMRGSKYVQSDLGSCFKEIKQALKTGRVLFTGTPCQTTALSHYVGDHTNLITCALICGGVPSPRVWKLYKESLEESAGSKIARLHMRSKETNWLVPEVSVEFENGRRIREILLTRNLYGTNFGAGLTISNACMDCSYKLDQVSADILIGDHWGINSRMLRSSGNKGASCVIMLTGKGKALFRSIEDTLIQEDGDLQGIIDSHRVLMKSHVPNRNRDEFFHRLNHENITDLFQEYAPKDSGPRAKVKEAIYKSNLYIPLFTARWLLKNRKK